MFWFVRGFNWCDAKSGLKYTRVAVSTLWFSSFSFPFAFLHFPFSHHPMGLIHLHVFITIFVATVSPQHCCRSGLQRKKNNILSSGASETRNRIWGEHSTCIWSVWRRKNGSYNTDCVVLVWSHSQTQLHPFALCSVQYEMIHISKAPMLSSSQNGITWQLEDNTTSCCIIMEVVSVLEYPWHPCIKARNRYILFSLWQKMVPMMQKKIHIVFFISFMASLKIKWEDVLAVNTVLLGQCRIIIRLRRGSWVSWLPTAILKIHTFSKHKTFNIETTTTVETAVNLLLSAKSGKVKLQFTAAHLNWTTEDWKTSAGSMNNEFRCQHSDSGVNIWSKDGGAVVNLGTNWASFQHHSLPEYCCRPCSPLYDHNANVFWRLLPAG